MILGAGISPLHERITMKVSNGLYLQQIKPLLKKLSDLLLKEYQYASILATDSTSKRYNVSKRGTVIAEDPMFNTRGYVVRVYTGTSYAEYSFNELSEQLLPDILSTIKNCLVPLSQTLPDNVSEALFPIINEDELTLDESTDYIEDPVELGDEKIVALLTDIRNSGKNYSEKILDCSVSCNFQCYHKVFISGKKFLEQNIMWTTGGIMMLSPRKDELVNYYKSFSNLGGAEILRKMASSIPDVAKTTLEMLDSKPIVPGEYDCICTPEVTGMIVHEAFGHGVEMDMFVKDRALAASYIDKYVASPLVTMHDGAASVNEAATYFFDDEGNVAHDTIVIDKGILKKGINDSLTAMALNVEPTGNGRRQSTERKAYTRMTNTYFEPGDSNIEEMIASIDYGFLLENARSGMEDPKNWGIQLMVNIAREIKDGKLTGNIFSPIVMTGYVPDLLKSISMVSNDMELLGSGACGKGYKEWVKVSDGGPYIKAKIRLG